MATITLTIPDAVMPRVIDALCAYGDRPDSSPLTRGAFAKAVVVDWVKSITRQHEGVQAAKTAETTARARVDAEISIS